MLVDNKSNGLTLGISSQNLIHSVDELNINANNAAVSLEETSAALEEITSNVRNNTENIIKMSNISANVVKSSNLGENLANQTNTSMEEINDKVKAINEAIIIIDQISFQTNILSLNAAVEAGKGFAVVAQEVRNLANRSAEAAKQIKDLVGEATKKADDGKSIAQNMINGYSDLNKDIQQTIALISDIEMASKEQLTGIEQINDAINLLDQQTQQNASIATQAHDVASVLNDISEIIINHADEKNFIGKDSVKHKEELIIKIKNNKLINTNINKKENIFINPKVVNFDKNINENEKIEEEWENF